MKYGRLDYGPGSIRPLVADGPRSSSLASRLRSDNRDKFTATIVILGYVRYRMRGGFLIVVPAVTIEMIFGGGGA